MENERYVGAFAMFNDITEKKRMEQQLIEHKKMEAITTLSEGIAHNFNDILMNIMGLTGLLLADTSPSQSAQADLKQIEQEVLKGSELTRQLLAFRHREHYVPKITDLNLLLDKVAKLFSQNKKGVAINKNLAAHLPAVEVDQGQIEQALMNLLLIAWEARSGPGELLLSSEEVLLGEEFCQLHGRKPGRYVYVQLTDSGIRDAEQTRAKIFEPFLTPPKIGLDPGLGLTSIYAIVKRHEGIIIVDDDQDEGVTFHLYLPVTQKILLTERAPAPRYIKGTGTILLVDDDDSVRAMESRMLERLGYKVIPVDTGSQAVSLYQNRQEPIDLVILDMVMPEMGGREVYHHLKKIDPQVKVMLYSGHTMDEDVYGLLEEGALGYIQKPYSLSEFSQKLADALNLPQPKLELLPQEAKSFAGDRQKPKKGKPAL
jgi:CheY-like chemotaxis protein